MGLYPRSGLLFRCGPRESESEHLFSPAFSYIAMSQQPLLGTEPPPSRPWKKIPCLSACRSTSSSRDAASDPWPSLTLPCVTPSSSRAVHCRCCAHSSDIASRSHPTSPCLVAFARDQGGGRLSLWFEDHLGDDACASSNDASVLRLAASSWSPSIDNICKAD